MENVRNCPVCGAENAQDAMECGCGYNFETNLYPKVSESPYSGKIVPCKTCGREVSRTAPSCPGCGETVPGLYIKCPSCSSLSFVVEQQGYSIGKAAIGWLLLGGLGLLGGLIGRKNFELVCMACGKRWVPDSSEFTGEPKKTQGCCCGRDHGRPAKKGDPNDRAALPDPEGCCVLFFIFAAAAFAAGTVAIKLFAA